MQLIYSFCYLTLYKLSRCFSNHFKLTCVYICVWYNVYGHKCVCICACVNSNPHLTFGCHYKHRMAGLQPAAMDNIDWPRFPFSIAIRFSFMHSQPRPKPKLRPKLKLRPKVRDHVIDLTQHPQQQLEQQRKHNLLPPERFDFWNSFNAQLQSKYSLSSYYFDNVKK